MKRRGYFFIMPIIVAAWFFVFGPAAQATNQPLISAGNMSSSFNNWQRTFSWPHEVTGDDSVLVVSLHTDGNYIDSVSYAGQAMTLAAKRVQSQPYNNLAVYIYYLANPTPGVNTIEVRANNYIPIMGSAVTFNNCDTINPIGATTDFYGAARSIANGTTTTITNSLLVDAVTYNKPDFMSIAPAPGQTQYLSNQLRGQTNDLYAGESYKLAQATGWQTMGWLTDDSLPMVHAIVALNPKYQEATKEPVVIVPGIMGSWQIYGEWKLDPILHTYDNLMEAMIAAGYKECTGNETACSLFTFPYNWRQDNNTTADLLKEKIRRVKEITGSDKVDIIAHSMGGLVTRSYIEGNNYQNDIDQVVFLGTPHQGSPESYLKYEGAAFLGERSWLQKYYFQTEALLNGYLDLTDYIRVMVPSVEELLPIYSYLKDKLADDSWQLRAYPLNYPPNNFLKNLNSQANISLLKARVKITNIVSDLGQASTLSSLKVIADPNPSDNKWQNGYPENLASNLDSLEKGSGDGTVPLASASSLSGVETIATSSSDHTNLPTIMQKEIIKTLTGKIPENYFHSKITSTIKRWLFFRVYSPIDFMVTAPDGKSVGKDFLNSSEVNEIPNAFYSGFDSQAEFILIPNPESGEYEVRVQGVANGGDYVLASSLIDETKEISKEFSGRVNSLEQREFMMIYEAAGQDPLGDLKPVDTTPPVITLNRPAENGKYLHSEDLILDYTATDDFSGLATTTITLDGKIIATTTIDLFDYSLGEHELIVTALDKAGNQAQALVKFKIITNIESTIKDIEEVYNRGWLVSKIYQPLLINAFRLLDTEARYLDRDRERDLAEKRYRAISRNLDLIVNLLNVIKMQGQINQPGYDIIINDVNYLRNNL